MELGENIQSYLRWRGDVPFSHAAVNHADALVLCKLAYFDLSRIAEAAEDQGITLAKCPSLVSDIHPKGPGDAGEGFFDEAASTARFGSVIARCYVDATPYDDDTQFSATEYVLPDGPVFVAFREQMTPSLAGARTSSWAIGAFRPRRRPRGTCETRLRERPRKAGT